MKRKLIAFDIDGTLLNSQKEALPNTLQALEKLRNDGHLVLVATGRSRFLAQPVLKKLDFHNYIVCNGSAAFLDHKQVYKHLLDEKQLTDFITETDQLKIDTAFVGIDAIRRHSDFNVPVMDEAMQSFGSEVPELDPDFKNHQEVYQALAYYDDAYEGHFDEKYPALRFVRWHEKCVDVIPENGSKAATILHLGETLGIDTSDIITFGDGQNDKEMLATAGVGVAMGNAATDVKKVASFVTSSNDEDGIFNALKELALI
ncbi:Cof-type HAD-IIB family hydrolase [Enterococcus dispar]|uniref:Cof-type HAD-IIB family hydrolase n=1 Tax=Enterococcus dispar TaxID=44009 RepID=UPI00189F1B8C|nr:Cof-type HAD-IIB family hydrolase [Enterococcus dispar]WCG32445.1 Cof-type HAD-IIB family hydrolase [Enterococcus dispar]